MVSLILVLNVVERMYLIGRKGKVCALVKTVLKAVLPLLCVTLKWVRRATVTSVSRSTCSLRINSIIFQYQNAIALEMLLTNQAIWRSKWVN